MLFVIAFLAATAAEGGGTQVVENPFSADAPTTPTGSRRVGARLAARRPAASSVGSTYFANCSAARAARAAPVLRGRPGYSRKLDRDGDGVGCE